MRENVGKTVRVKAGDTVVIECRLPRPQVYARLGVWSAIGDYEMSPHVQNAHLDVQQGRPHMIPPLFTTLRDDMRKRTLEFVADEDMAICVRQEKDAVTDPSIKVRIHVYGTFATQVRQYLRNCLRAVRSYSARPIRQ